MNLFTELREGLGISWAAIRANKMRSVLTTLGIVIGIVTVTLMGTAIEGLNRAFLRSVSVIGADVLYVQRSSWMIHSHEEWLKMMKRRPVTLLQVEQLGRQLTLARAVAPAVGRRAPGPRVRAPDRDRCEDHSPCNETRRTRRSVCVVSLRGCCRRLIGRCYDGSLQQTCIALRDKW